LTALLPVVHTCPVGTAVALDDMRQSEPETESVGQTGGDGNRLSGTGGLVDSAQDGLDHGSFRATEGSASIHGTGPRRNRW